MKDFFLQNWFEIIKVTCILASLIYALIMFFKKSKAERKQIILSLLESVVRDQIVNAEEFKNYSSEEAKQYVFTRVKEWLITNKGIKFVNDEIINQLIETNINFSCLVNSDEIHKQRAKGENK